MPVQDLRALAEGRTWQLEHRLPELASLTPVRGWLRAVHRGSVLEVEGEADTIVTLSCDRCLQQYNHPLRFRTRELLWLRQADGEPEVEPEPEAHDLPLDLEPDAGDETIDPRGSFDPAHWTFEQLSLQLPLVNRCGADCPGPAAWGSSEAGTDPRWAGLAALRLPSEQPPADP
ncbi:DUF177 domain-containing protein [Cyanobium sp. CH-040]|uniref:YceD family protein n=1 Tax=Cyanobium sp. CH-040 TaxID=2823708 RepID=UPI0020CBB77D|nr:DUF177 domain-containing protein [Cyanobium sp. CH-040]